jgi:hypothetical protein
VIPDPDLEARLATLEPPYRSKGEARVGRLLDRYGVPFFYEQPMLVLDDGGHRLLHPDFTLPTYDSLILEFAGMPDKPEYMRKLHYKQRVYRENAIPALFIYPQDLTGPSWPERLYERIVQEGQQALQGYSAVLGVQMVQPYR